MKLITPSIQLFLAATLATTVLPHPSSLFAEGTDGTTEPQFPFVIPYELGASGFSAGDQVTISQVRGDRKHIESGGSYIVEGTYTLASADRADLAFYCTTRGPSGPTPVQAGQRVKITNGTGSFHLYETNVPDGWLHVSIYANNSNHHGGIYLGEQDREKTIMRNQGWFREFTDKPAGSQSDPGSGPGSKANLVLLAYLGNPVPRPTDMDLRYDKQNLLKAFTALCQKENLVITKLAVDDSEFPFLVYGTLDGTHTLPGNSAFEEQRGYAYGGSVRGSYDEGTYFAVSMVPSSQYPESQREACNRRLMLRLQMLAEKAQQSQ